MNIQDALDLSLNEEAFRIIGKALTPAVKQALGLVQGKTMGIGTGTTWLLAVRASSPLGQKIQQWHLQPKKLGKEAKEHLLASNEEYRA